MFKKLKDKLAEDLKLSPQRIAEIAQTVQNYGSSTGSNSSKSTVADDKHFSIADEDSQDGIGANVEGFTNISLVENQTPKARRTSTSSIASDASFLPRFDLSPNAYHLQSDLDISASEIDEFSSVHSEKVDNVSKENLYRAYRSMQAKYNKYRGRYTDLARHYKDLEHQNEKAKAILGDTQDKALRRVSELKEQCALEQRAKAHLEEALRMEIDEKQLEIDALKQKVGLLQKSSGLPIDLSIDLNSPPSEKQSLLEAELKAKDMIILDLRNRDESHKKAESEKTRQIDTLTSQVDNLQFQLHDKNEKITILTKEIDNFQQHTTELQKHVDILTQEVEQRKRETEQRAKKVSYLNEEKLLLKTTFDEIKNEYEQLKVEKDKQVKEFQEEIVRLNQEIISIESLRSGSDEKNEQIVQLQEKITSMDNEIDILKSSVLPLQDQVDELQKIKANLEDDIQKKIEEISKLNTNLENLTETNLGLGVKIKELDSINGNLQRMFNLTEEHLQTVRAESEEKTGLLEEQRQRVHSLESKLHQLRSDNERLLLEIAQFKQEHHEIENRQIEHLTNQLHEKNAALAELQILPETKFQINHCVQQIHQIRSEIIHSLLKHIEPNHILETDPVPDITLDQLENFIEHQIESINHDMVVLKKIFDNNFNIITSLKSELETTKIQHLEQVQTRNNQVEECKNVHEKIDELTRHGEKIEIANENFKKTCEKLQEQLNTYEETVKQLHDEIEEKQQTITRLNALLEENFEKLNSSEENQKSVEEKSHWKIEELNWKIAEQTKNIEDLKNLNLVKDEYEENLKRLRSEIEDKEQTITRLNFMLEENSDKLKRSEQNQIIFNEKIAEFHRKINELNAKIAEQNKTIEELENLNLIKDEYEENLKRLHSEIEDKKQTITKLNFILEENVDKLKSSEEDRKIFDEKFAEFHRKIDELNIKITEQNKTIEELENLNLDKNDYEDTIKRLHSEIEDKRQIITRLTSSLEENSDKLKSSEQNQIIFNKKIEEFHVKINELNIKIAEQTKTIEELQNQITDSNKTIEILTVERNEVMIKLENQISELEKLRVQVETKDGDLNEIPKLNLELVETKTLLEEHKILISALELQLDEARKLREAETSQIDSLKAALALKAEEIDRVKVVHGQELASLREQIAEHSQLDTGQMRVEALETELAKVQFELTKSIEEYQSQVVALLEKISDLENCNLADKDALGYAQDQLHKLTLKNNKLERKLDETIVTLNHATSLNDSTEMEYLRNILFQYMTGKEPVVLAGVIAAVCKFSEEQTDLVVQRENQKTTLLGTLGFI